MATHLMRESDGKLYIWTEGLSKEPGFLPCDKEGKLVSGAIGLQTKNREVKPTDPYQIMPKETLVQLLKSMPGKVETYFSDKGEPIPDFSGMHIATLRKLAKEIVEADIDGDEIPEEKAAPPLKQPAKPGAESAMDF